MQAELRLGPHAPWHMTRQVPGRHRANFGHECALASASLVLVPVRASASAGLLLLSVCAPLA